MTEHVTDSQDEPSRCTRCCEDLNLPILHLLLPDLYLDADGLAFYRAHGLDQLRQTNALVTFEWRGLTYRIGLLGLLRPDVWLDAAGQAFYAEHDLDELLRSNARVRVLHRCAQLDPHGRCRIYDTRPRACREFDCAQRPDCALMPAGAVPLVLVH